VRRLSTTSFSSRGTNPRQCLWSLAGEKPYNDLKSEVGQLEDVIQQQQYDIAYLESQMTASNKPAYDPYDPWGGWLPLLPNCQFKRTCHASNVIFE
jgi:hypothetical protein